MADEQSFRKFLVWAGAVTIAGALSAIAFVVIVDPYRLYQLVDVAGFNQVKPALDRYQEEIKLTLAYKAGADVVLLGNSRVEIGLDPASLANPSRGDVPYNLAISGTGIATAREELETLHAAGKPPKRVVLGLDFVDFLVDPSQNTPVRGSRTGKLSDARVDRFGWKFDTFFSLASVMDAWATLRLQHEQYPETMAANGANPLFEYNKYARDEGYFAIFQQRAIEYASTFVRKPHGLQYADSGSSPGLDDLHAIIALASRDKIELQLLIYPYHAQMLAMFEEAGLWPAFDAWKNLVAGEAGAVHDAGATISLWDFSGFSSTQCEPIPAKGDRTSIPRGYWESGHFKQNVGAMMLARLQASDGIATTQQDANRFGMALSLSNLKENRQRIAQERAACAAASPQIFKDASQLIKNARASLAN